MSQQNFDVLIVGGGQGGHQTAESLRANGFEGSIGIVGLEDYLPYQQPPLSKAFLKEEVGEEKLPFRNAEFYRSKNIELCLGEEVLKLDAAARAVQSADHQFSYGKLVLATGATPRRLPVDGADLNGILTLRTLDDARALHQGLKASKRLVIVGAGFIGLEVASTALALGLKVTLVEAADRVMARAVSPTVSSFFESAHRAKGLDLRLNTGFKSFVGDVNGAVSGVILNDGSEVPADLVLMGIGATPNDALAKQAGLKCENGIVVDAQARTSDPNIYAIGDCSNHPNVYAGTMFRLESVQNAIDQGKLVAEHIVGKDVSYTAVPWFWSDQQGFKLQMVGLPKPDAEKVELGDKAKGTFIVGHFENETMTGIETINMPAEQMAARQLIGASPNVSSQEFREAGGAKGVLMARRKAAKANA